ncbi:hypothetical protein BABINDRAFT_161034 [Babjeviella inositovora NRRL Y-12698]|uniref:Uncharacterized protein n=1 Tax=Babjeviella inositovora NRRL Y-12698 TaxID=984486 RepID=A0A1E3QT11_9ASCO|nr:uncharacterized protein BABINDRAFT_161034 [Babjeviella inositovora NRRL Y-12698]ODQ80829.1 hypothetical protein BABINDRAFT_161034 [Babjeviella inositovora NRRL Y-12698]
MSFWPFGNSNGSSSLNKLLESPDLTLDELLDNPDLLSELREGNNNRLLEFVVKPDNLVAMVNSVVDSVDFFLADETADAAEMAERSMKYKNLQDPLDGEEEEESADDRLRRRYHVASQVLALDSWLISDLLADQHGLLVHLWSVLAKPLVASLPLITYFTKINEQLLDARPDQMLNFIRTQGDLVDSFLRHIEIPLLMDLLLKITLTDKPDSPSGIVELLHEQHLVAKLLAFLQPQFRPSMQSSAGDFLKALITISANTSYTQDQCIGPNELTRELVGEKCIQTIIGVMLGRGSGLATAVGIVIEVIRKNNSDYDQIDVLETTVESHPPNSRDPIFLGPMIRLFSENLGRFSELFVSILTPLVATSMGVEYESLGYERYKISELVAELLHCSNMKLLNSLDAEKVVRKRDIERKGKERRIAEALDDGVEGEITRTDVEVIDGVSGNHTDSINDKAGDSIDALSLAMEEVSLGVSSAAPYDPCKPPVVDSTTARLYTQSFFSQLAEINNTTLAEPTPSSRDVEQQQALAREFEEKSDDEAGEDQVEEKEDSVSSVGIGSSTEDSTSIASMESSADDDITPENPFVTDARDRSIRARPTLGDLYKIKLLDSKLLENVISSFLRFPWNNFYHNVVFDLVQQVLQGKLHSYNSFLVNELFNHEIGLTNLIILGHQRCTMNEIEHNLRLGYMGHVILIAEEIVQFTQMYKPELISATIYAKLNQNNWVTYVNEILMKTREMYNCVLGGIKPTEEDVYVNPDAILLGDGSEETKDADEDAEGDAGEDAETVLEGVEARFDDGETLHRVARHKN